MSNRCRWMFPGYRPHSWSPVPVEAIESVTACGSAPRVASASYSYDGVVPVVATGAPAPDHPPSRMVARRSPSAIPTLLGGEYEVFGIYSSIIDASSQSTHWAGRSRSPTATGEGRGGAGQPGPDRRCTTRTSAAGHSESPLGRNHPIRPTLLRHRSLLMRAIQM